MLRNLSSRMAYKETTLSGGPGSSPEGVVPLSEKIAEHVFDPQKRPRLCSVMARNTSLNRLLRQRCILYCHRPYCLESTSSRLITEVKHG